MQEHSTYNGNRWTHVKHGGRTPHSSSKIALTGASEKTATELTQPNVCVYVCGVERMEGAHLLLLLLELLNRHLCFARPGHSGLGVEGAGEYGCCASARAR